MNTMGYKDLPDERLWIQCINGDIQAFRELYVRFYALLCNYGIRFISDRATVEDTVQDLFVRLIQRHGSLSPTKNLRSYLLKALRNRLYDLMSQKKDIEELSLFENCFQQSALV